MQGARSMPTGLTGRGSWVHRGESQWKRWDLGCRIGWSLGGITGCSSDLFVVLWGKGRRQQGRQEHWKSSEQQISGQGSRECGLSALASVGNVGARFWQGRRMYGVKETIALILLHSFWSLVKIQLSIVSSVVLWECGAESVEYSFNGECCLLSCCDASNQSHKVRHGETHSAAALIEKLHLGILS